MPARKKTKAVYAHCQAYVDSSVFIAFLDRSDTWHSLFAGRFATAAGLSLLEENPHLENWSTDQHMALTGCKLVIG